MKHLIILTLVAGITVAHANPLFTSWLQTDATKYARVYQSTADETAGTKSLTWARGAGTQSNPVYAGVSEVNYSTNWVYIRTSGLASHMMGPWYLNAAKTNNFPNFPANTASVYRIPRNPTVPGTKTSTGGGTIGRFVNGVSLFDNRDAFSYVTASGTEVNPGGGIWLREAYVVEGVTFDAALAHPAGANYHYHVQPIALRYQLGDHVDYNATTNRYTESAAAVTQHSPILAWAADGFPIYGPYGYSDPTNAASSVRRMVTGFTPRNGANGTTNLAATGRITLPAWAAVVRNRSATLLTTEYGPAVGTAFALGRYLEDNDYLGDLGFTQTTGATVRDFDLDKFNGRICVTPDFPTPHFCYFTTIKTDGTPAFPYTMGRQYYGSPTGGATNVATMTADTPLTQQFISGPSTPIAISTPVVASPNVTLTWSSVEGGTYSVEASQNQSTWTSKATGLAGTGTTNASTYAMLGSSGTEYGRVNRTALATYDTNGFTAATVAQTTSTSYLAGIPNTAPTITSISAQTTVQNTTSSAIAFTIGDAETAAASLTLTGSSSNTTLVPNVNLSFGGNGASRTVTITPATNQTGSTIITVSVSDGTLTANSAFTLSVTVMTPIQLWRYTNYGSTADAGTSSDTADNEQDGVTNLMEYATAMNPAANDVLPISATIPGASIEFIYTKNKAATDVSFIVEWSDTLSNDWSTTGVTSSVFTDGATTQQIKALVPANGARRFVRLKVTQP